MKIEDIPITPDATKDALKSTLMDKLASVFGVDFR